MAVWRGPGFLKSDTMSNNSYASLTVVWHGNFYKVIVIQKHELLITWDTCYLSPLSSVSSSKQPGQLSFTKEEWASK